MPRTTASNGGEGGGGGGVEYYYLNRRQAAGLGSGIGILFILLVVAGIISYRRKLKIKRLVAAPEVPLVNERAAKYGKPEVAAGGGQHPATSTNQEQYLAVNRPAQRHEIEQQNQTMSHELGVQPLAAVHEMAQGHHPTAAEPAVAHPSPKQRTDREDDEADGLVNRTRSSQT